MNIFILLLLFNFSSGLDDLSIPEDAVGAPKFQPRRRPVSYEDEKHDIADNRCFCNYEDGICNKNNTCIKHEMAACYHATTEIYDKENRRMATQHYFGCAPLEKGSNASHLTCNSWRSHHVRPSSIICCYEGNYCNKDIEPPPPVNLPPPSDYEEYELSSSSLKTSFLQLFVTIGVAFVLLLLISGVIALVYVKYRKSKHDVMDKSQDKDPLMGLGIDDSGSGSGQTTLNQRTVAKDLEIIETIGRGRYGEVRKATYRGSLVAVKTFYTTDEHSWRNERDIYMTHMLNHQNILQFVAADICSQDSVTKMLLVTDFHELGSLYDYLRRNSEITPREALDLAYSSICGIDHLHAAVYGTGSQRKPEIAHRDLKSKNIIVKSNGVCCIADFGLAVRFENGRIIPEKSNVQVGTKRYMAPEVLSNCLNPMSFSQFKMADIYSFALVLWEIINRMEFNSIKLSCADLSTLSRKPSSMKSSRQRIQAIIHEDKADPEGIMDECSYIIRKNEKKESTSEEQPAPTINENVQKKANTAVHSDNSESSGYSSSIGTSTNDITVYSKDYQQPYEDMVIPDPSFDQMSAIVCDENKRPPISVKWQNYLHVEWLKDLTNLLEVCWHTIPSRRHTALKIKMEMKKVREEFSKNDTMGRRMTTRNYQEAFDTMQKDESGYKSQSRSTS